MIRTLVPVLALGALQGLGISNGSRDVYRLVPAEPREAEGRAVSAVPKKPPR